MATFEESFNSSTLEVIVPTASFDLPSEPIVDEECLATLTTESKQRHVAFFDEKLDYVLLLRMDHPSPDEPPDPQHPPIHLLSFLAHLQVSYEATYISSVPTLHAIQPPASRLSAPPRTSSNNKLAPRPSSLHPTIFPPHTPNPTPSTAETDRQYVQSEGKPLAAGIWGESMFGDTADAFRLTWSTTDECWVAIYRLSLTVQFLTIHLRQPLLCLTVSITLRDKPLDTTRARQPLADLINAAGGLPSLPERSPTPKENGEADQEDRRKSIPTGLGEVNLLAGLAAGPTFAANGPNALSLPSSRLGPTIRQQAFSLLPPSPHSHSHSKSISTPPITSRPHPTLRKSFRKTLQTVSGFRVRMRTVFVPYILFPSNSDSDSEREKLEAGNEERTVVLAVEVENSGESSMGFAIERVEVMIGGEGATTKLIGCGKKEGDAMFPVLVGCNEQYNLLYAVAFWQAPEGDEWGLSAGGGGGFEGKKEGNLGGELQRAVCIDIHGRPFEPPPTQPKTGGMLGDPKNLSYPARTFSSRWNCVLDLSPNRYRDSIDLANVDISSIGNRDALPTPASPFPHVHTPIRSNTLPLENPALVGGLAGSKRHTVGGVVGGLGGSSKPPSQQQLLKSAPGGNYRASTSMLNPAFQRDSRPNTPKLHYTPPSLTIQQQQVSSRPQSIISSRGSSPPLPPPPSSSSGSSSDGTIYASDVPPPTPAYPAYPTSPSPLPGSYAQAVGMMGNVGPSVEVRRERGGGGSPMTPRPRVMPGGSGFGESGKGKGEIGEMVVVSVGLLELSGEGGKKREDGRLYPLDQFTLDIFVFNQSSWIRRFEVSYPDGRRRRGEREGEGGEFGIGRGRRDEKVMGLVPLENRIRVGPLRPSTCQSVRMEFLALTHGVHTIDTLTLTDIETGYSMNLRSVMDIVVHEIDE
ncbi:hypothetical protein JAAARDRAFT_195423 [Jaapia argillacea MUCL 33604]|uniref:Trafficking protein particle complex II-specific subunit 65 IgD3 domain-containing protein n=1 Tax=Jaapia argillacea MUCL 33604 TaxID=933084 RepID=A0A067PYY9_9AGAM|nr:hypothetical protein JAAARDRAFT_195423 [Jaapia argillacea MUCL 33604]